jgi:ketosteroid isomerase-like protein
LRDLELQTVETIRRLGEVDRELIKSVLAAIFARRMAGDVDGMLEFFAADVVCFPETTWGHARYPRRIVGREAVREALKQRHINYVTLSLAVHRTLIDGDQVAVHVTTKMRERGSGVSYTFDAVSFFRFRDGLVVELCEFPDGSAYDAVVNFPH